MRYSYFNHLTSHGSLEPCIVVQSHFIGHIISPQVVVIAILVGTTNQSTEQNMGIR